MQVAETCWFSHLSISLLPQGAFAGGPKVSQKDLELAPKLYALRVAGKHFKNFEIPADLTAVHAYVKVSENHVPPTVSLRLCGLNQGCQRSGFFGLE